MGKNSFIFYDNWAVLLSSLSDKDAGQLIKSICNYRLGNAYTVLEDNTLQAINNMVISTMDGDAQKYEETCEKRRASGSLGGLQKQANATKSKQMLPNDSKTYQNIAEKDKDKDKEKDNEKEKDLYEMVQSFYNACPNFKDCTVITKTRMLKINELHEAFTLAEIEEVFKKANDNEWLCGGNDKHWKADFDWLIDIDNFVKVQDGRYDGLSEKKEVFGLKQKEYKYNNGKKFTYSEEQAILEGKQVYSNPEYMALLSQESKDGKSYDWEEFKKGNLVEKR